MGRVTMTLIALVKASIASVTLFLRDLKPLSWKKAALENGTGPSYLPGADKLSQEEKDKLLRMKFFGGWKMFWTIYECMSDNTDLKIGDALPDGIEIFDIQSKTFKSLSDAINPEKTTILNFGSCT